VILDECVDEGLRHAFGGHDCQTCRYAGLKGLTNGELLAAAEAARFEVLVTVDQNLPYQQTLVGRAISLMVLTARTTNIDDLLAVVPEVLIALETLRPWMVVQIGKR
jgi:hypothetical protein